MQRHQVASAVLADVTGPACLHRDELALDFRRPAAQSDAAVLRDRHSGALPAQVRERVLSIHTLTVLTAALTL